MLTEVGKKAFSLPTSMVCELPLYKQLSIFKPEECDELVEIRLQGFSANTIFSYANGIKPYNKFCQEKKILPFPATIIEWELFCILMVKSGKSAQSIKKVIKSLIFGSNFGIFSIEACDL